LLARGHEAHAVFSSTGGGGDDLQRVAAAYADRLTLHRADARKPAELAPLLQVLVGASAKLRGLVLAAAAPPLPMSLTAASSGALADYVADGIRLVAAPLGALLPLLDEDGFILFCSSAALDAPPREWPHYVAAKGAIEGLAAWASDARPMARVVVARLPKMLTGMTNSPGMRIGAVAPDVIAERLVDRLEGGEFPAGLTVLRFEA
jgi:NAD(P)-dependent dehydrogenase (short-subunit alcohol dehydrogenase family)